VRKDKFILDAGLLRGDGMEVIASEMNGPGYQVAIGFSEVDDCAETKRFANSVIGRLRHKWRVDIIDPSYGIEPASDCK